MAVVPNTRPPEVHAYPVALAAFAVLHFGLMSLGSALDIGSQHFETQILYLNLFAYGLYMLTGFISAALTRRMHVLNGAIAGVLAALIAILAFRAGTGLNIGTLVLLLNAAILGGLGGACSMLFRTRRTRE